MLFSNNILEEAGGQRLEARRWRPEGGDHR